MATTLIIASYEATQTEYKDKSCSYVKQNILQQRVCLRIPILVG